MPRRGETVNYHRPGHLYIMQRASDGACKVGRTSNVITRLKYLNVVCKPHGPVTLIALVPVDDMAEEEKQAHDYFGEYHIQSEWFAIPPAEIENFANNWSHIVKKLPPGTSSRSQQESGKTRRTAKVSRNPEFYARRAALELVRKEVKLLASQLGIRASQFRYRYPLDWYVETRSAFCGEGTAA